MLASTSGELGAGSGDCGNEKCQSCGDSIRVPRRLAEADATVVSDSPWISGDILALMVTALLGIGTFTLQARSAKQSDANQQQSELASRDHEVARGTAERQLARVREQMALYASPMLISSVRHIILVLSTLDGAGAALAFYLACPLLFIIITDPYMFYM